MRRRKWRKLLETGLCVLVLVLALQVCLLWLAPGGVRGSTGRREAAAGAEHRPRPGQRHQAPGGGGAGRRGGLGKLHGGTWRGKPGKSVLGERPAGAPPNATPSAQIINNDPAVVRKLWLLRQHWSPAARDDLLATLEAGLFTDEIGAASDSVCYLPAIRPPQMCGQAAWECGLSPTYVQHDRRNRTLHVQCQGEFRINFVPREESETRLANDRFLPDRKWETFTGPRTVPFPSQYADVVCPAVDEQDSGEHHNYRTQFVPNVSSTSKQRLTFEKRRAANPDWRPLSVLSINLDSMSRPHFHRSCGLPKTARLLRDLYYPQAGGGPAALSHRAFLFNRLNSIGGVTAMNLTPLYAGLYLRRSDEEKRVLLHRYPRKIKEWMWDYANSLGFLTSYGVDTGNGLFGTRTVCKTCTNRPGSLPHWEDGWVKRENEQVRPGVRAGLCDGDTFIHEHIMNYTQDFLDSDYPSKWAAFDLNAKHRPEAESATQIDDSLVLLLTQLMKSQPNLVIFLFGDHGDRYHGNLTDHAGSYVEIFLPFLAILVPGHVLEEHPEWEKNLLINSQRYLVHYDLHHTMKSLMHYPALQNVTGQVAKHSYNLFTEVVPRSRTCDDAKMPYWSCVCGGPKFLPQDRWTSEHLALVQKAVTEINEKHSEASLLREDPLNRNLSMSCVEVQLANVTSIAAYEHEYAGLFTAYYHITFTAQQGPSIWQVTIDSKASIDSLKQVSRYRKYEDCRDYRVSIEFCICQQFPEGTP